MSIRFYNATSKQWELHYGAITDLEFAEVKFQPTFKIVDTYSAKDRNLHLFKIKLEGLYTSFKQLFTSKPLTPRERALKALQENK